jgi:hypothetical protein
MPRQHLSTLAAAENQGINMFRLSHFYLHVPTAMVLRWDPSGLIEWMRSPLSPRKNSWPDLTSPSEAKGRAVAFEASPRTSADSGGSPRAAMYL